MDTCSTICLLKKDLCAGYEDDDTPDYAQKWLSNIRRGSSVRVKCMNKVEAFDEVVMAQLGRGKLFAFPASLDQLPRDCDGLIGIKGIRHLRIDVNKLIYAAQMMSLEDAHYRGDQVADDRTALEKHAEAAGASRGEVVTTSAESEDHILEGKIFEEIDSNETGLDGFGCLDGFGGFEADTNEMQPEQCVHKRHDEVRKRAEGWSDFCNVKPYLVPPKVKVRTRTKGLVDSQNLSAADTVEIAALKKRIRTGLKTRKKKRFGEKIVPD